VSSLVGLLLGSLEAGKSSPTVIGVEKIMSLLKMLFIDSQGCSKRVPVDVESESLVLILLNGSPANIYGLAGNGIRKSVVPDIEAQSSVTSVTTL
jgi:hypothetical protein